MTPAISIQRVSRSITNSTKYPNEASPRDGFDREEVRRRDRAPLRLQEGLPAHRPLSGGIDSVLGQDALDRVSPDGESEIREGTSNPRIAPPRVVARHFDDPIPNLARNPGPARTASRASVVLLRDELSVPAEQGVRGHDRRELAQPFPPERLCLSRQQPTLGVGKQNSLSFELLPERLVFGLQILDHLFLLAAYPTDEQEHEELNRERHRAWTLARLQRAEIGIVAAINVRSSSRFRKEFASAEFWHDTPNRSSSSLTAVTRS